MGLRAVGVWLNATCPLNRFANGLGRCPPASSAFVRGAKACLKLPWCSSPVAKCHIAAYKIGEPGGMRSPLEPLVPKAPKMGVPGVALKSRCALEMASPRLLVVAEGDGART